MLGGSGDADGEAFAGRGGGRATGGASVGIEGVAAAAWTGVAAAEMATHSIKAGSQPGWHNLRKSDRTRVGRLAIADARRPGLSRAVAEPQASLAGHKTSYAFSSSPASPSARRRSSARSASTDAADVAVVDERTDVRRMRWRVRRSGCASSRMS